MVDKNSIPADVSLSETHEYVRMVDKDIARIGISEFAAEQLGDIVFVELPEVGDTFEKGESFGSIESVKASSELYMPITCEILAVNETLQEEPSQINDNAFQGGWMLEVSVTNLDELEALLSPQDYNKTLQDAK
ncbi:MAG: glycine cleavage system protein GcvH [Vampirovibrionales bacterium]|nr:glycine cleavage system protein GcvH [Vampirovibrionales bacterium]